MRRDTRSLGVAIAVFLLVALVATVDAGVVWQERSADGDVTTTYISGSLSRVDSPGVTSIVRLDLGLMWNYDRSSGVRVESSFADEAKTFADLATALPEMAPEERAEMEKALSPPLVRPTTETRTVADHPCTVVEVETAAIHYFFCIASDLPMASEQRNFYVQRAERAKDAGSPASVWGIDEAWAHFAGLPVEVKVVGVMMPRQQIYILASYQTRELPASIFEATEGYKDAVLPEIVLPTPTPSPTPTPTPTKAPRGAKKGGRGKGGATTETRPADVAATMSTPLPTPTATPDEPLTATPAPALTGQAAPDPRAEPLSDSANAPAALETSPQDAVAAVLLRWLDAWQRKDLDGYLSFYSPGLQAQGLDFAGWRRKKAALFAVPSSHRIDAADMRIGVNGDHAAVYFLQHYQAAHEDHGAKSLILELVAGQWRIVAEEWSPIPAAAYAKVQGLDFRQQMEARLTPSAETRSDPDAKP